MKIDVKEDFPLAGKVHYLDSAALSLKPAQVIMAVKDYYENYSANTHRGVYRISELATDRYESSREKAAAMFGCSPDEIVFTKNTTESLNLLAYSLGNSLLKRGDTVLLTKMEHHSNIIPWLMLKERIGINVEFVGLNGTALDYDDAESKISGLKPKVFSFVHGSNVLGTINDAERLVSLCSDNGIISIMDCAQTAPHMKLDFDSLNADFAAFSSHKMLGPTGVGVLFGKSKMLEGLPPFLGGGNMVQEVGLDKFMPAEVPQKFEAGTQNIAGVIGYGAALDYIKSYGHDRIESEGRALLSHMLKRASELDSVDVISSRNDAGPQGILHAAGRNSQPKVALMSFNVKGVHPHDVSSVLDGHNVCVRAGHHCAQPLHRELGVASSVRASLYLYNRKEDIDALFDGISEAVKLFLEK